MPKLTKEQFIEKARAIHGDKYDYSKVEYVNAKTKVCIICPEHGEFWMRPDNFINSKQECPKCWAERRGKIQQLPQEEFIKRAIKIHNDLYDYNKVHYSGFNKKVCIVCKTHGDFWQTPSVHLNGHGCPFCSGNAKKWNKETCLEEARKYKYIHDYSTKSSGAYNVAMRNGWLKEYTWLERLPAKESDFTKGSRCIYAYEFKKENSVYVGLTNSMKRRDWAHRNGKSGSSVFKFATENKLEVPSPIILEKDIPTIDSGERENYWVSFYMENGWNVLNKAKTGRRESSLGSPSSLKWNRKRIKAAAKECEYNLTRFMHEYGTAYYAMLFRYRGMLSELFPNRHIHTHHSVEDAIEEAKRLKCSNRSELRRKCIWAYKKLFENNLLDDLYPIAGKEYTNEEAIIEAQNYRSIESIRLENHPLWSYLKKNDLFKIAKPTDPMFHRCKTIEEAWDLSLHYKSITELANHAKIAYRMLREAGLLKKRYPESIKFSADFWTEEECHKVALKCKTKTEFRRQYPIAFKYAKLNNWINQYTWFEKRVTVKDLSQDKTKGKARAYWTYERCYQEALKYTSKKEFNQSHTAAPQVAYKKGWFKDYTWLQGNNEWSEELCLSEAKKYKRLVDFYTHSRGAYDKALKTGWLKNYTWLQKKEWSFEECKEEAKKYTTRNAFKLGAVGAYRKAVRLGWINDFFPKK